ncbi:hypothetical protein GGF31_004671 [Allomyces arbusculus]|nr:hypothetical protein GGF31_004671 [Allomyces arbusculus]
MRPSSTTLPSGTTMDEIIEAAIAADYARVHWLLDQQSPKQLSYARLHDGQTLLHAACLLGQDRLVQLLLDKIPVNISAQDNEGNTALHVAALMGHLSCAALLVACGASPTAANYRGQTPVDLAPESAEWASLFDGVPGRLPSNSRRRTGDGATTTTAPTAAAFRTALPNDVDQLRDIIVHLVAGQTRFQAHCHATIAQLVEEKWTLQQTVEHHRELLGDSSDLAQLNAMQELQFYRERNDYLMQLIAKQRHQLHTLQRDLALKESTFQTQLAQLTEQHRTELREVARTSQQTIHDMHRQMSMRSVSVDTAVVLGTKPVAEMLDEQRASAAVGTSTSRPASRSTSPWSPDRPSSRAAAAAAAIAGSSSSAAVAAVTTPPRTLRRAQGAVVAATMSDKETMVTPPNTDATFDLESTRLELVDKLRSAEARNSILERELADMRQSLVGLHEHVLHEVMQEASRGQADMDARDESQGLILFANGGAAEADGGQRQIRAAVPEKLVERLIVGHPIDYQLRNTFLLTYREFMTPEEVLAAIQALYRPRKTKIVSRIYNVLSDWMTKYWCDFQGEFLQRVMSFLRDHIVPEDQPEILPQIECLVKSKLNSEFSGLVTTTTTALGDAVLRTHPAPPPPVLPKYLRDPLPVGSIGSAAGLGSNPSSSATLAAVGTLSKSTAWLRGGSRKEGKGIRFLDLSMVEVARQLTLVESELFRAMSPLELIGINWMRKNKEETAATVLAMTRWFNHVMQWVRSEILMTRETKTRAVVFERFITLADELLKLNNFNGVSEIMAALESSAVWRLERTKSLIPTKSKRMLQDLVANCSPDINYKSLRALMRDAQPPAVPFPAILERDLYYLDRSLARSIDGKLVNFQRYQVMADLIQKFQYLQSEGYNLTPVPEIQAYVRDYVPLSDDDAYERSLACEPR